MFGAWFCGVTYIEDTRGERRSRFLNLGFVSPRIIIDSNKSNQPDASISQTYCSPFKYSSTCFGHDDGHEDARNMLSCI